MKIVIAGGTGFIGKSLRKMLLTAGHEVIVLTREPRIAETEREKFVIWDGATAGDWVAYLEGSDAVINLTGENIAAKRWTALRKRKLLSSRVDVTRLIVTVIGQTKKKPVTLINVSAVGCYGDVAEGELFETGKRGEGFLARVCEQWEAEARKAESFGVRVVLARLGPVLGEQGGMLSKMLPPFLFFMGGPLGDGKQWISWVHLADVAGAFLFILRRKDLCGPVNITAPHPVTMEEFCSLLGGVLCRPCWFPTPSFFLRAFLGEMASIILSSQKVMPQKLLQAGYKFQYPHLSGAFRVIFKESTSFFNWGLLALLKKLVYNPIAFKKKGP
jgi:hypothetical protein